MSIVKFGKVIVFNNSGFWLVTITDDMLSSRIGHIILLCVEALYKLIEKLHYIFSMCNDLCVNYNIMFIVGKENATELYVNNWHYLLFSHSALYDSFFFHIFLAFRYFYEKEKHTQSKDSCQDITPFATTHQSRHYTICYNSPANLMNKIQMRQDQTRERL